MHLILTGATGRVGAGVLDAMLKRPDINRISILSRRPVQMADDAKDPRINVIIHQDFEKYDGAVLEQLRGANGCVWALGRSQNGISKEEYIKLTKDYTLAAAKAFQEIPPDAADKQQQQQEQQRKPFRFIYVSGMGTTFKPGVLTPLFGRVKGEVEQELAKMRAASPTTFLAHMVRPGGVDYRKHTSARPYLPADSVLASASLRLMDLFSGLKPDLLSPSDTLGDFLTEMAMGRWDDAIRTSSCEKIGDFGVVENAMFRQLKGLDKKK